MKSLSYQVVVVGGGISGLVAAIASARTGAQTALIHDRGVLGGNSSSDVKVHITGASCNWKKPNAVETGILLELLLRNRRYNPSHNFYTWDGILLSVAKETANLDLYLNTSMVGVSASEGRISSIDCYQMSTETRMCISGSVFIDATGDGTLGYEAGAEYRVGHEAASEFNEPDAPKVPDKYTMGASLYFTACDVGHKVDFVKPDWAYTFTEKDFENRPHGNIVIRDSNGNITNRIDCESGYWWVELGGDWPDQIAQAEDVRWELYKITYGIWDHLKNTPGHGADNYELTWVGNIGGRRETRRLVGPYLLTENDVLSNRVFPDGVAFGGFWVDDHPAGGWNAKSEKPSDSIHFNGIYGIPYSCYYSRNIRNLMMAGRDISATKMGMSSSRVMGTCAVGGQAAGTAAAMCALSGIEPDALDVTALQNQLMKDDAYLYGIDYHDPANLLNGASVSASSSVIGAEPEKVLNGKARNSEKELNCWMSDGLSDEGECLSIKMDGKKDVHQIRLIFDPNLSEERFITLSAQHKAHMRKTIDPELVKDYEVVLFDGGREVWRKAVCGNYQRLNILDIQPGICADELKVIVRSTNGFKAAVVFEVRVY